MDKETNLIGKLLLAMPAIGDPRFHKSVILVCAHDENGAMGLVVNNVLPEIRFHNLLDQIGLASDIEVDLEKISMPVMNGGPVENSRGFLLHSAEFEHKDTVKIDDLHSVTGTIEALHKLATGDGPKRALFVLGYAGWTAGQLEQELAQNAWLVTDSVPEIVFHKDNSEKWDMAVNKMGFDPSMLSSEAGRA